MKTLVSSQEIGLPAYADTSALLSNPAVLYLASLGSAKSRRVMQSRLKRFADLLNIEDWKEIPWQSLDRPWLLLAKEALNTAGCVPQTINGMLALLKGVALQAWELQLISDHCYLRIKNTKSVRGHRVAKRRLLEKTDLVMLLDDCLNDERLQGLRDAAMLSLLYSCGLRRSELVAIDVIHIDFKDRSVRVLGKGNKERLVYPPTRAWEMLQEWLEEGRGAKSGPLFCRIRKNSQMTLERLTDQAVYYIIQRLILKTGIDQFTPHDLRAWFISYLLDQGEDIKTVADIVGHADIRTTAGYDRRGEMRKRKANRSIDL
jgi:integrase/recombinase XerD